MGFFNILKLSIHNLKNNKLRTLLTIIVLAVVSFVVIMLSGFGYSLYESINASIDKGVNEQGVDLSLYVNEKVQMPWGESYNQRGLSLEEVDRIIDALDDGSGNLSYISLTDLDYPNGFYGFQMEGQYNVEVLPFYEKSNPYVSRGNDYLVGGRMWTDSDRAAANVWLSENLLQTYEVGDKIVLKLQDYSQKNEITYEPVYVNFEFTVQGFLKDTAKYNRGNVQSIYINYAYFDNFQDEKFVHKYDDYYSSDDYKIRYIYAGMIPQSDQFYDFSTINYFDALLKNVEGVELSSGWITARSEMVELLRMSKILTYVIFGVVLFISLIIILLSIGSVANTIKISAEQNRKFFGVMKAIGMKNKSLRQILSGQIVIMTIIAVALMSMAAYLSIGGLEMVLESLLSGIFYGMEPIVISSISIIIPFAVALVLIGFVLLFTRSSLYQFSRMDVITVINEVN